MLFKRLERVLSAFFVAVTMEMNGVILFFILGVIVAGCISYLRCSSMSLCSNRLHSIGDRIMLHMV